MRRAFVALTVLLACGASAADVSAQTAPGPSRGFFGVSAGMQAGSLGFNEPHSEPLYGETFTWNADYDVESAFVFDVAGGGRVWRNLVIAGALSRMSDSRPAQITGGVPHPFFFNRSRSISGESQDLDHVEQALHASVMWVVPAGRHAQFSIFGGPTFFHVTRDFVEDVTFSESYPFDEATFQSATASEASDDAVGFHVGGDLTWLFTPQFGAGVLVRYARGAMDFDTPAGGHVGFDAGGLQVLAGLRVRFGGVATNRPAPSAPVPLDPGNTDDASRISIPGRLASQSLPTGSVATETPVFLRPDATRTPLRQLPVGTRVRILEENGDWLRVEFNDDRLGRRVGYVNRTTVDIDPRPEPGQP